MEIFNGICHEGKGEGSADHIFLSKQFPPLAIFCIDRSYTTEKIRAVLRQ